MKIDISELAEKYKFISGEFESNYFDQHDIEWFDQVSSTMEIVDKDIQNNIFNRIVIANYQNSGKGRFERSWESPVAKNLLLSVPIKIHSQYLNRIPIISTMSVLDAVKFFLNKNKIISIKWPNDILVNENKISGILIKTHTDNHESIINLGIGLNVNTSSHDYKNSNFSATSLKIENKSPLDLKLVFYKLIKSLSDNLQANYDNLFNIWKKNILIPKKNISIEELGSSNRIYCKPIEVNNKGLLVVKTDKGNLLELTSEEVTFHD